jgi:dihydrofolate reductase
VEEAIAELKQAGEEDVVCFGGARLAHSLARARLIDEYDGVVTHVLAATN